MTRRERKRLETIEEIVDAARQVLRDDGEMSFRAITGAMGMTPSALYRYVDSAEALHSLVARSIYADVVATMTSAGTPYPDDDVPARLAASATAFRSWALAHQGEFRLVFANPLASNRLGKPSAVVSAPDAEADDGSKLFSDYFAELFIDLHSRGLITVPSPENLDSSLIELVERSAANSDDPIAVALGREGMGTLWLFKLAWARLYGVVMLEVFGRIDRELIDSGAAFGTLMRETFASIGLEDSWDRLVEVSKETSGRVAV